MTVSWLKKGSASQEMAKQEQYEQEQQAAQRGRLFRFFLKDKEEAMLTFVDGELSDEGFLLPPRFYEHTVQVQGKWVNIACPEKTNPSSGEVCPICKGGNKAVLVSLFTVIDHRGFVRKDGTKVPYSKKLLVAKPQSMEILARQAIKRGGLMGATFEVTRMGDQAAGIGNQWEFTQKETPEKLVEKFMVTTKNEKGEAVTATLFSPADYDSEIEFKTGEELSQAGFAGFQQAPQASYAPGGFKKAPGGAANYKDQL